MMHSTTLTMTDENIAELFDSEIKFLDEAISQLSDDDDDVRQKIISSKGDLEQASITAVSYLFRCKVIYG